jgi:hypothetical protein
MYADLRTLAWAQIIELTADGVWTSSATGSYRLWLSEGSHEFYVTTIGEEQLWQPFHFEIMISGPGAHTFCDITLTGAGVATPEFTSATLATVVLMITLLIFLPKRQRNRRQDNS